MRARTHTAPGRVPAGAPTGWSRLKTLLQRLHRILGHLFQVRPLVRTQTLSRSQQRGVAPEANFPRSSAYMSAWPDSSSGRGIAWVSLALRAPVGLAPAVSLRGRGRSTARVARVREANSAARGLCVWRGLRPTAAARRAEDAWERPLGRQRGGKVQAVARAAL